MPIVTGPITKDGATINLIVQPVDAGRLRERAKQNPLPRAIRGILDTGAAATGVSHRVLKELGLFPIDSKPIRNPVGPVQIAYCYKVRSAFVAGGTRCEFAEAIVIATDCFDDHEEHQALIGRDVLDHCSFQYWGTAKTFQFAY